MNLIDLTLVYFYTSRHWQFKYWLLSFDLDTSIFIPKSWNLKKIGVITIGNNFTLKTETETETETENWLFVKTETETDENLETAHA